MTKNAFDLDQFLASFYVEAAENTATLESTLLALESQPGDKELIAAAFRAAHSLKGGSGLFGLTEIARFTHALESVLEELRLGSIDWCREIADMLLRSVDVLRELIEPGAATLSAEGEALREALITYGRPPQSQASPSAASPAPVAPEVAPAPADDDGPPRFAIHFFPCTALFARGMDPLNMLRDLAHTAEIVETRTDTSRIPDLASLEPTECHIGWDLVVRSPDGLAPLEEVFEFVEGYAELSIKALSPARDPSELPAQLDDLPPPVTRPPTSGRSEVPRHPAVMVPGVYSMAPPGANFAPPVMLSMAPERAVRVSLPPESGGRPSMRPSVTPGAETGTIRISTRKLDGILDLVGELVIAKSMIGQSLRGQKLSPLLLEALGMLERQTRELQEGVMSVRMVPVSTVFGRFHRVVRELGSKLGKEVVLSLEGADTEVDKAMVEQLVDPLTHLVRNAIDHGLETPADRAAAGKSSSGTLKLSASHRGGNVIIEITDDGRGLALERVREKAIERGLLAPDAQPTIEQLHMMVFEPGFSTAAVVSDVSGRGVGMDVVKRNVETLGGTLYFTSQPGQGSVIRLQLPLTMAIIDGLLLRVGSSTFVVPLLSVLESFRPTSAHLSSVLGRGRVIQFRGAPISLIGLGDALSIDGAGQDPTAGIVIVVEAGDETVGLFVDDLIADTQVVVKSLETNFRRVEGLAGAAVLGDGQIALILDVAALVRRARLSAEQALAA